MVLNTQLSDCATSSCSAADLVVRRYLTFELCAPVGGLRNASALVNQTVATQTAGAVVMGPTGSVAPFTGEAGFKGCEVRGWLFVFIATAMMITFV